MLSLNFSNSIILLKDFLLSMSFSGKLGVSGMLLMGSLRVFTDSRDDDCLVLGVAKDKSLAGRLEYSNCSIKLASVQLKLVILSLTRYE